MVPELHSRVLWQTPWWRQCSSPLPFSLDLSARGTSPGEPCGNCAPETAEKTLRSSGYFVQMSQHGEKLSWVLHTVRFCSEPSWSGLECQTNAVPTSQAEEKASRTGQDPAQCDPAQAVSVLTWEPELLHPGQVWQHLALPEQSPPCPELAPGLAANLPSPARSQGHHGAALGLRSPLTAATGQGQAAAHPWANAPAPHEGCSQHIQSGFGACPSLSVRQAGLGFWLRHGRFPV